jgi:protein-disulfide isomerase
LLRYLPLKRFPARFAAIALAAFAWASAGIAQAGIASLEDAMKPMVVGKADAPVTIFEFASLGCPHCAHFHETTYPELKKNYIDTGKVKLVFTDFPLGGPALAASMIARCAGPSRYFGFIELFFRAQEQWSRADPPIDALKKVARFGGLTPADVDACIKQQPLIDFIQGTARKASKDHEINSTPSFLVNGTKVSGALPYAEFKVFVDEALKKAQTK